MLLVDPGVVDQHVDPAELVDDSLDQRPHLLGIGDVSLHDQMPTATECGQGVVGRLVISTELDN